MTQETQPKAGGWHSLFRRRPMSMGEMMLYAFIGVLAGNAIQWAFFDRPGQPAAITKYNNFVKECSRLGHTFVGGWCDMGDGIQYRPSMFLIRRYPECGTKKADDLFTGEICEHPTGLAITRVRP